MRQLMRAGWLAVAVLAPGSLTAQVSVPVEFSADAVQVAPQRGETRARMFVGKEAVRTEYVRDDQPVVQLVFPGAEKSVVLLPQQRTYAERAGLPNGSQQAVMSQPDASPCAGVANTQCTLLGRETIGGRAAEKWEFVSQRDGQTQRSLHWLDVERKLALREYFPDGTVSELGLVGQEVMNGRKTEKWKMLVTSPEGRKLHSFQWYDPELKITIREEMPGGYVRELRNIRVGQQPAALFQVPPDYKKTAPSPAAAGARGTPAGRGFR